MIGKQVSAFGKSEKSNFFFSVQLNQSLFSVRRYGFPQIHVT